MKTPEEKRIYCREWRAKNRDKYLAKRRTNYHKNKENYREEAKERSRKYYYEVMAPKREANREEYRKLDKVHSDVRLAKRKALIRELREKLGGRCSECGFDEINLLQFHHHEKNKVGNVCEIQSMKKMITEAEKCILLCPNCHARETLREKRK